MRIATFAALIALHLAAPAFAEGEIYKYTDAKGSVRFTTKLDEVPPAQRAAAQASAAARVKKSQPAAPPAAAASDASAVDTHGASANGRVRSASQTPDGIALIRNRLLKGTAASHGIDPKLPVWGVLMEEGLEGGHYYTLVALADGSGSIYFSTGGGVIGGKSVPAINAAARRMVERATRDMQPCGASDRACFEQRPVLQPEKFFGPPGGSNVRFLVLTSRGVYTLSPRKNLTSEELDVLGIPRGEAPPRMPQRGGGLESAQSDEHDDLFGLTRGDLA